MYLEPAFSAYNLILALRCLARGIRDLSMLFIFMYFMFVSLKFAVCFASSLPQFSNYTRTSALAILFFLTESDYWRHSVTEYSYHLLHMY